MIGMGHLSLINSTTGTPYTSSLTGVWADNYSTFHSYPTVTYPSGIQANSVGILCMFSVSYGGIPAAATLPTGYTSLINSGVFPTSGTGQRTQIAYKKLTGSESGGINGINVDTGSTAGGSSYMGLMILSVGYSYTTITAEDIQISNSVRSGVTAQGIPAHLQTATGKYVEFSFAAHISYSNTPTYNLSNPVHNNVGNFIAWDSQDPGYSNFDAFLSPDDGFQLFITTARLKFS